MESSPESLAVFVRIADSLEKIVELKLLQQAQYEEQQRQYEEQQKAYGRHLEMMQNLNMAIIPGYRGAAS